MTNAEKFMSLQQIITSRIKQEELLEANQPTETSVSTTSTTQSNEITIRILNKYGNDLIYPVGHKAQIFADMLGQKTFTRTNIKYIKSLGFTVKQTFEEVDL